MLLFLSVFVSLSVYEIKTTKRVYIHQSQVDWTRVQVGHTHTTYKKGKHAWKLAPPRVKYWVKAGIGSVFVLFLYGYVWFAWITPHFHGGQSWNKENASGS